MHDEDEGGEYLWTLSGFGTHSVALTYMKYADKLQILASIRTPSLIEI